MKQIFKSLLRYKTSTILNIVGLSCAFATFIIISMQIRYDVTYDRHNENFDSIYQLVFKNVNNERVDEIFDRPVIAKIKDNTSTIEHISILSRKENDRLTLLGKNKLNITQYIFTCDEDITNVFTFEFIEGNKLALQDPTNLIVSDKFAKQWYGDKSPIGEMVSSGNVVYTIAAVFKKFPGNATLKEDVFCNIGDEHINDPNYAAYKTYIKLQDNNSIADVEKQLIESVGVEYYKSRYLKGSYISILKLADVRHIIEKYNKNSTYMMIMVALAIIILASINFINFATSMVPLKIKGINLRKVVGATKAELRIGVVFESLILTTISFIVAIVIVELFKDSTISYIISDLSWDFNKIVYCIALGISILTGIISGIYPAFYSTSFQPALILKSRYALSASGRKFRTALIGFQFFISFVFITSTIFLQLQHDYLIGRDGGYVKDGIIHVAHGGSYSGHDVLKEDLLKNSQIIDVTYAGNEFGTTEFGSYMSGTRLESNEKYSLALMIVAHNFLDFFDIKIESGRNFIKNDRLTESGSAILSKIAVDKYDFLPTEKVFNMEIVGVCENINLSNMKHVPVPHIYLVSQSTPWGTYLGHAYIKVSGNSKEIFEHIQNTYKKTDPDIIVELNYLTDILENSYSDENTTKQIMQTFSLIAIIIALVGVFGLVSFDTKYRRKEIGLRRINGATITNILLMFSTSYIKIMFISFVLSVPLVYYIISQWLKDFPYRIDIYWWVFALAFVLVFGLTIVISVTQTISAARKNPVESLKSE